MDDDELVSMNGEELRRVADEIARYVIDEGRVEGDDAEWWIMDLVTEVMMEADERGYKNPTEIGEEAERLYKDQAATLWNERRSKNGI